MSDAGEAWREERAFDRDAALAAVIRAAGEADSPMLASSEEDARRRADVPLIGASAGRSRRMRGVGLGVAAGCAAVLGVAARVQPSDRGVGTHERLGLPPCGFLLMTGLPCPTCGMTSAFAWMMHGHPLRSAACQPLGAALCLAAMAAVCVGLWMAATGRRLEVDWVRFSPAALMLGIAGTFFLGWGAKIAYGLATGELPYRP